MGIPLIQQYRIGKYLLGKKIRGVERYPVVLMLEPLFRCNLACAGCGKIDYPDEILNRRLSVEASLQAVDECGAPIVSIPGGEPLLHKEIRAIVEGIIARKKFVYLCTNALLLKKNLRKFTPSEYLTFSIHLDGKRERHDASVCQAGVFDKVVDAIEATLHRGFRVTINYTLFQGETAQEVADFLDFVMDLGVEGVTLSPGYSYENAPQQDAFLRRAASERLFREVFRLGKESKRKWRFNQSSLFLDFLAGNRDYRCTPWGNPTVNVFGWQKPCYLLSDEGFAPSFQALMEETEWDNYGTEHNPKCANCMMHCGYEPTAIDDTLVHPIRALRVALKGPSTGARD
uniref:Hopanoid biosynthesis associated radical SAM protein HpnH n=1 Tax=Candidatus Kentrum sp. FW TaxID=2126338 RepID=A0A450TQF5_9GAMM|nr:MAG: hopanoid biosynthesis associated radical SAM protein HpnH [Candidatus Kentron sp. FW]